MGVKPRFTSPLTLGIGGHVVEAFTYRFEASQIVMLIERFFETLQCGALHKPHLAKAIPTGLA